MRKSILITAFCLLILIAGISCEYERMTHQPSLRHYEGKRPDVAPGAVPIDGGEAKTRLVPVGTLQNPIPSSESSIARGQKAYFYYCVQCHGSRYDGEGTVGQSFFPLPTDLMDEKVQAATDDYIFRHFSYGGEKAPPLAYTISLDDRWHIVNWIRSLGEREKSDAPTTSGDYPLPKK
jgi:mono/diheme cytochrome c family protein